MNNTAVDALTALLAELPAEFSSDPLTSRPSRDRFVVIKERNVRAVHEALWTLQQYFGMTEE